MGIRVWLPAVRDIVGSKKFRFDELPEHLQVKRELLNARDTGYIRIVEKVHDKSVGGNRIAIWQFTELGLNRWSVRCAVEGCYNPVVSNGMCRPHYHKERRRIQTGAR
jgi:hypothetical protein